MTTLLLDMDGPLADFDVHFWERCIAEGWAFDIQHHSHQRHRYFTEHIPDRAHRRAARAMVDAPGWFRHLPVTPGARDGVTALLAAGIDIWVCTKPLEVNPTCRDDKGAWLADHFPELLDRLIIAPDKSMVHGDVLLDDAPKRKWFDRATWWPVIFDAPYNRDGSEWAELPRFSWGDDIGDLLAAGAPSCPACGGALTVVDVTSMSSMPSEIRTCHTCWWSAQVSS